MTATSEPTPTPTSPPVPKQAPRQALGAWGEAYAADFLTRQGYRIIERNWRMGRMGELDLLVSDANPTLIAVEIKTGRASAPVDPVDQITLAKRQKLQRLLLAYRQTHPDWAAADYRLDALIIVKDGTKAKIRHIRNVSAEA